MYFDLIESLEDNIKIYQNNEMIIIKKRLKEINKIKISKKLNYWLVDELYLNYLIDFKKQKFVDEIFRVFKEKLPVNKETLNKACQRNNLKVVKELVKVFSDKLPIDITGYAFTCACYNNNMEMIEILFKVFGYNLPIDVKEALYYSSYKGNIEIIKFLIRLFKNEVIDNKDYIYYILKKHGHNEILEYLKIELKE